MNQCKEMVKNPPKISPTFCVYPWMELLVGPSSNVRLCCIAETAVQDENHRAYNFEEDSLESYWNSYGLRQVRKKMLAGEKIKACEHCYHQESIGRTSYRQSFNKHWLESENGKDILNRVEKSKKNNFRVEEPPLYMDIRPGNLCNLKCRMCNPGSSSKIYKEQKELLESHPQMTSLIETDYFKKNEKKFHNWYKKKEIWDITYKWTKGIKQLYFTGGEPTLIKENWNLINYVIEKNYSKNIDLVFNINCTQAPSKLLDTFKYFSNVTLSFSIDGYKETQEYIRYPSKWIEIEANIVKILKNGQKNVQFYFSPVVQVYNILSLVDFFNWVTELQQYYKTTYSLIMCTSPRFLDIAILPKNIKQEALYKIETYEKEYKGKDSFFLECLNSVKNVLKTKESFDINKQLKNLYKYTKILDQKRGNEFEKTFPELNQLLNEDGRWNK